MYENQEIWTAVAGEKRICVLPKMANRHGLIAGATGTGKTITLKVMAESFSDCGVPVFLADVKGDLAGMVNPGTDTEDMKKRIEAFGLNQTGFAYQGYPTCFWDIYGTAGIPLRTTISNMGPTLLARLMDLNETQSDILHVVFKIADDDGLLLIDTKDLRAMLQYVYENAKTFSAEYGNMAKNSITAIIRSVVALEEAGGAFFFGEPELNIRDWFTTGAGGKGMIHIFDCQKLIHSPLLYSTFMLWMLSELFETLPEAGDLEKPRMVFFFDEAHLLFDGAPKALLDKVEQVVKLIRSKGVGIYFITQNPSDIPDDVLAQLGNKVQHALHAYTPAEQKKVKAAAQSFRPNPAFDTMEAITNLGIGEALISFLDGEGRPGMVEICRVLPPQSQMGPIGEGERKRAVEGNPLFVRYGASEDRESAYEVLSQESKRRENEALQAAEQERLEKEAAKARKKQAATAGRIAKTATGTIGREIGNELGKKVGGSFGRRLGGNIGAALGRGILDTLFKF